MGTIKPSKRLWTALAGLMSAVDYERMMAALATVQHIRSVTQEVQSGMLHFLALPARKDIRRLQTRVMRLESQLKTLDGLLTRLEQIEALTPGNPSK